MTTAKTMPTKPKRNYSRRITRQEQALVATLPADFPRIPCVPESRCKLCQLKNSNEDLFHQVNRGVVGGTNYGELVQLCAAHGVKSSTNSLTRHKAHLMQFVAPALATHLELTVIAQSVGDIQDGNMAVIITKLISLSILPSLREIAANLKSEDAKVAARAEKAVRLALDVAKTASAVQTADATTRLRAAELEDRLNRRNLTKRQRVELAVEETRLEMERHHPELWAQAEPILTEFVSLITQEETAPTGPRVVDVSELPSPMMPSGASGRGAGGEGSDG